MHPTYRRFWHATALVLAIYCASIGTTPAQPPADPLSLLGLRATVGAAPGYVPDIACKRCHPLKYQSYQHVGMAQSLKHPGEAIAIEDFGREFFHEPSQRHYLIRREGDDLIFRRHQRDAEGKPINVFETRIDWVLGSGNRSRSYLYRTAAGELFELPLGWYSESRQWGMSPGFESRFHPGVRRQVQRECLFCHNAFPEVAADSDLPWRADTFPQELPRGTGCQRCHGPGAEHIRAVLSGASLETIHERIVNPRKLPPELRDSVCFQCHMLPVSSIVGMRRFERPIYSFRPGESLADYLVHVDIQERGMQRTERFEINHHGYRFWQSSCYRQSQGKLACISCHDPHEKPKSRPFREQVAGVCRGCHQDWVAQHSVPGPVAEAGCVGCHMPTRRTRDVVLVTMTDHRIARGPFDPEKLVEPLTRHEPVITDIELLPLGRPPAGDEGEIYRISPVLRAFPDRGATQALQNVLARYRHPSPVPYLELLEAQLKLRQFAAAEETATALLKRHPEQFRGYAWLGLAQFGQGKITPAMASLQQSLELKPLPKTHFNLASIALRQRDHETAAEHLDAAIALRPSFHEAWKFRARLLAEVGDPEAAKGALIRCLEIEPADGLCYADLVTLLRLMGEDQEAQRFLAAGLRFAWDPTPLQDLETPE